MKSARARNLVCCMVVLNLALVAWAADVRADSNTDGTTATFLGAGIGAFVGGGTALLIYDPFAAHRREVATNPEQTRHPVAYCLPHAGATAAGFLLGLGVGALLPATTTLVIVELITLVVVMLTDFYIVHRLRQPVDEEPEGPPIFRDSGTRRQAEALRLEIVF